MCLPLNTTQVQTAPPHSSKTSHHTSTLSGEAEGLSFNFKHINESKVTNHLSKRCAREDDRTNTFKTPQRQPAPIPGSARAICPHVRGHFRGQGGCNHWALHKHRRGPCPSRGVPSTQRPSALTPALQAVLVSLSFVFCLTSKV